MLLRIFFRLLVFVLLFYLARAVILWLVRAASGGSRRPPEGVQGRPEQRRDDRYHVPPEDVLDARFTVIPDPEDKENPPPASGDGPSEPAKRRIEAPEARPADPTASHARDSRR